MSDSQPSDPWDSAAAIGVDAARFWILDHIRPGVSRVSPASFAPT